MMGAADAAVAGDTAYLTVAEVAEILRVERDLVRRLCSSKQLKATKFGGRQGWRIARHDLDAFMGVGQQAPTRPNRPRKPAK
jgi:excisionase family DNA binding protein